MYAIPNQSLSSEVINPIRKLSKYFISFDQSKQAVEITSPDSRWKLLKWILLLPDLSAECFVWLFVGFILVLFALIFEFFRKDTLGILVATTGGILLHFIGFKYAADGDTLGVLVAVLNSNFWLATHVTTITTGYGVSIVAGLMAHIYFCLLYTSPSPRD